ncbi:MAG TPA: AAA family ATPase, partial [Thermoanaerobaculia bacterium]|nr:AAA family ATPase [Thermoanaerobaculia bacterium]
MFITLLLVFAVLATIGGLKYFQIRAAMAQGGYSPPPEAVTTVIAQPAQWDSTLNAIGSVAAVNGVTVSADLPGVVESICFTSGQTVGQGAILVRLDTRQERAQLAAGEAQRDRGCALPRGRPLPLRHGHSHPRLDELAHDAVRRASGVFLCEADIPYADTADRSGRGNREMLQRWVVEDLQRRGVDYVRLRGSVEERAGRVMGTFSPHAGRRAGGCGSADVDVADDDDAAGQRRSGRVEHMDVDDVTALEVGRRVETAAELD